MRVLVGCSSCQRRYDASDRRPGSRFRCHCGEVITIQQVEGHEAAVVRCGNCGAPRATGAASCGHCGMEFASQELVRNTICPSCLTRCGDEAKFCHHCGGTLASEAVDTHTSELPCPVCGGETRLEHHRLGDGPAVLECPSCAGLWLEHAKIQELVSQARAQAVQHAAAGGVAADPSPRTIKPQDGPMYRSCPVCSQMMNRRNYGRVSGVVIDQCKTHGTWFDADELPAILRWVEAGGLSKTAEVEAREQERRERAARERAAETGGTLAGSGGGSTWVSTERRHGHGDFDVDLDLEDLIGGALGALGRLFGRR